MKDFDTLSLREEYTAVNFYSINLDTDKQKALEYLKRANISTNTNLKFYWDPQQELATKLEISAAPAICLLDSNWSSENCLYGHSSASQLRELIERIDQRLK